MESQIQFMLRAAVHAMRRHADKALVDFDITNEQGHVLSYLYHQGHASTSQYDLQQFFKRKGSTISSIVKNLERKGLIVRKTDMNDERRKILLLTDEGKAIVEGFEHVFHEMDELMLKDFSAAEKLMIEEMLKRMYQNLS